MVVDCSLSKGDFVITEFLFSRFLSPVAVLKVPTNKKSGLKAQSNIKPVFNIKPAPLANKYTSFALGLSSNKDGLRGIDKSNNDVPEINMALFSTLTLETTKRQLEKSSFKIKVRLFYGHNQR